MILYKLVYEELWGKIFALLVSIVALAFQFILLFIPISIEKEFIQIWAFFIAAWAIPCIVIFFYSNNKGRIEKELNYYIYYWWWGLFQLIIVFILEYFIYDNIQLHFTLACLNYLVVFQYIILIVLNFSIITSSNKDIIREKKNNRNALNKIISKIINIYYLMKKNIGFHIGFRLGFHIHQFILIFLLFLFRENILGIGKMEISNLGIFGCIILYFFSIFLSIPKYDNYIIQENQITIRYTNLELSDILTSRVFIMNNFIDKKITRYKLFKIDISKFLERQGANGFRVLNYKDYYFGNNREIEEKKYFYYIIPVNDNVVGVKYFNLIIQINKNGKVLYEKLEFYVNFSIANSDLVGEVDSSLVPLKFKFNKIGESIYTYSSQYSYNNEIFNFSNVFIDCYHIVDLNGENSLNKFKLPSKVNDKRKFLYHKGEFGVGKTTFDLVWTLNENRSPIIISPWEANSDHDFLYLLFMQIKRKTKTIFHKPGIQCFPFFMTLLISIVTFLYAVKDYVYLLFNAEIAHGFTLNNYIYILFSLRLIKLIWETILFLL